MSAVKSSSMPASSLEPAAVLPADARAVLVGRIWRPDASPVAGPAVVAVCAGEVFDLTPRVPTVADLLDAPDPLALARDPAGLEALGPVDAIVRNSDVRTRDPRRPWLLAPVDLQAIKACGVTFMVSLIERVIEERTGGDPQRAEALRATLARTVDRALHEVKPGSAQAAALKQALIEAGMWSQYMEVAIGPDAEVFTKAQPLSAVGYGAWIGVHPASCWNNPEPEIVIVADSSGRIRGATLGNDVNLRDVEGRSALLLGKAKDNNGACAIGPFLRLFDDSFTLDSVRRSVVTLEIAGATDGFVLRAQSDMAAISRDPEELVAQTCNAHHQYPDGFALFLGTMFAPTDDREEPGMGFTHKIGDEVRIATPALGTLVNVVAHTDRIPPWNFGVRALYANLLARGFAERVAASPCRGRDRPGG